MSLRMRILLVAMPPLIATLLIASLILTERWQYARDVARVAQLSTLVSSVGGLVHELQKERGVTSVFLSTHGAQFRTELAEQHRATSAAQPSFLEQSRLIDAPAPALAEKLALAKGMLTQLPALRADVNALSLQTSESFAYFTGVIHALLEVVPQASFAAQDPTASRSFLALFNFMQAKERAGQERALGAQGFAAGHFAPELYQRFLYLRMEQDTFLQMFGSYATGEEQALFRRDVSGPALAAVDRLRALADSGTTPGDPIGVDESALFTAATARIDLMRAVEVALAEQIQATAAASQRTAELGLWLLLGGIGGVTVLVGASASALLRSLTWPLRRLVGAMTKLAKGDTAIEIPAGDRADEIGAMARALAMLRDDRMLANRLQAERLEEHAMRERQQAEVKARITAFGTAMSGALHRLDAAGEGMSGTSGRLSNTASQAAERSAAAAVAVSQAAHNADAVAAAVEQLAGSAQEIGHQAATAAEKIASATDQARHMETIVAGLFAAAEQVGSVVALLRATADQTSLLALNATIKAARAGMAGRSFAVVASEVKALASRTNQATDTIAAQVATMQGVAREGVATVKAIARSVENVGTSAVAVAAGVEAQAAATDEITRRAREIADGTVELQDNMSKASAAAAAAGSEAGEVRQAAEALGQQAGVLRSEIETFFRDLRAA